ncbi:hypothetical protein [Photobacterium damselae]|uniref:hypothetical protein n=1 Tax=Photobacterium damselae TaxID=38293 RepID=UPI00370A2A47
MISHTDAHRIAISDLDTSLDGHQESNKFDHYKLGERITMLRSTCEKLDTLYNDMTFVLHSTKNRVGEHDTDIELLRRQITSISGDLETGSVLERVSDLEDTTSTLKLADIEAISAIETMRCTLGCHSSDIALAFIRLEDVCKRLEQLEQRLEQTQTETGEIDVLCDY